MPNDGLQIEPIAGALGAEVSDVDLRSLDTELVGQIRAAFVDHQVLVFRDQELTPDDQVAFGRHFGELDTHPFVEMNDEHPEVLDIVTEPEDRVGANFGGGWHTDLTFMTEPDLGSILYAIEVPPAGGDTLFASQLAAYDSLSDTMKSMLDGLVATHSPDRQYGMAGQSKTSKAMVTKDGVDASSETEHPVVRTHPESGRKGLYVNPAFTEKIRGMRRDESAALLSFLYEKGSHEAFTCRVKWQPGTLTMWDNRSVQHFALHDYAGHRRHMRRITVKGDRPV